MAGREHGGFCPRFFVDNEPSRSAVSGSTAPSVAEIALGAEDTQHALKVLRVRKGDCCQVVTPSGRVYAAVVSAATDPVRVEPTVLLEGATAGAAYRTKVGLVQALARPSLMDYVIEKGTEVGASFFLLVPASGSPRLREEVKADRLKRWRRIAREAAKQSRQTAVPWVDVAESVTSGLDGLSQSCSMTLILEPGAPEYLPHVLRAALARSKRSGGEPAPGQRLCFSLWVGPEGGWTDAELHSVLARGAVMARLGRAILRAETAGPVGVAVTRLELDDW